MMALKSKRAEHWGSYIRALQWPTATISVIAFGLERFFCLLLCWTSSKMIFNGSFDRHKHGDTLQYTISKNVTGLVKIYDLKDFWHRDRHELQLGNCLRRRVRHHSGRGRTQTIATS